MVWMSSVRLLLCSANRCQKTNGVRPRLTTCEMMARKWPLCVDLCGKGTVGAALFVSVLSNAALFDDYWM